MYKPLAALTITLMAFSFSSEAIAKSKVVYHYDSRVESQESPNPAYRELSKSTAAQIRWRDLEFDNKTISFKNPQTLRETFNVCEKERFSEQLAMANCSGFLVAPDLLVTAGHCVVPKAQGGTQCANFAWVFDYNSESLKDGLSAQNVYGCKEVLEHGLDSAKKSDYALVRLDRAVDDRRPLEVRTSGKVETGADLVMMGHPSGLPTKVADGATVRANEHPEFFKTDLDAFGGNSGSAVMDAHTGVVEGILVRGAKDYRYSRMGCYEVNLCENYGGFGCYGESASRITSLNLESYLYSAE